MSDHPEYLEYAIGLDIGGTNMVAGVIACADGRVVSRHTVPTDSNNGPEDGLRRMADLIDQVLDMAHVGRADTVGIGIGCSGPVDPATGRVHNPYTLPGWDGLPIVDHLTATFDLPAYIVGDAQCAALGEHWIGAGKGSRHMIYITVGTGIGGAVIVDARLHQGTRQAAGEVGHQVIDINGPFCYCGARGCLEMLAAAPAITQFAVENAPQGSLLLAMVAGDRAQITPQLVSRAANQGDPFSRKMMQRVAFYLGTGIANLINILAPELIVMGGGVMQSWSLLAPGILDTVAKRAAMVPVDDIKIVPAKLGLNAGITGGARLVLDRRS